jgi:hypothetical protein
LARRSWLAAVVQRTLHVELLSMKGNTSQWHTYYGLVDLELYGSLLLQHQHVAGCWPGAPTVGAVTEGSRGQP